VSIVHNARRHVGRAVILQMDIPDFFTATRADRVQRYFEHIGWNREAATLLVRLCTYQGGLPQGAPTSPMLSNIVNYHLDSRLAALEKSKCPEYSRYADDITFSFTRADNSDVQRVIRATKLILRDEGYGLHTRRKMHLRRHHQRQLVCGLVVNHRVA